MTSVKQKSVKRYRKSSLKNSRSAATLSSRSFLFSTAALSGASDIANIGVSGATLFINEVELPESRSGQQDDSWGSETPSGETNDCAVVQLTTSY